MKKPPTVLDADNDLGPAMQELTIPQRAFVVAYCEGGGTDATAAALAAGYGTTDGSARTIGATMLRKPRILAALREEADKRLKAGAIVASSVLVEVAADPMHRDRYKAAVELLNRAGLVVEGVSRVIVEDHRTVEEIERRIGELCERLGIDKERLMGTVIDAEYEEIKDETSLSKTVARIHDAGDEWQRAQRELDAILERSET
jgi:phage terminase small subunit